MQTNSKTVTPRNKISKIAIDMHRGSYRTVRQIDESAPQPAQKFEPGKFTSWLGKELERSEQVVVCYEAGCFGYEPARRMQKMGATVYVIAPQNWDEQGKKQVNDKLDAQVMSRRLNEYLGGHRKALSIVHIPTPQEEAERSEGRMRDQLRGQIRRMQAMGRSLLMQREVFVQGCWWKGAIWKGIVEQMPAWVVAQLEVWKKLLEVAEREALQWEKKIEAAAPEDLFLGEGRLTHQMLHREMLDPTRFKNSRQVGNYFGLCPSESTTGNYRRLGSITKHGNPRLRRLMVLLAWRMWHSQRRYRGCCKWEHILGNPKAGGGARKKALVALARQLAVDWWRMATGRISAEQLGLRLKKGLKQPAAQK